ncbi:hypothetical protein ABGB14_16115 [Nonomuraea sp. B10E15]|uniref:serine/threonine-protein kinase n=1 Tax=Nonomuraea sp. B10E15 TaxID=3153560 RepID=UPI00325E9938
MTTLLNERYRLTVPLDAGERTTVWRARDEVLHRDVTVRALDERDLPGALAAARLRHPAVAAVHDVFTVDGRSWLVAELPESRTLGRLVAERGPLPAGQVAALGADLLEALVAGHTLGALHGAVQPDHVLEPSSGRWVLTGFGTGDADPAFTAPECRAANAVPVPASDLWSLAATLLTATGAPLPPPAPGRPVHGKVASGRPALERDVPDRPDTGQTSAHQTAAERHDGPDTTRTTPDLKAAARDTPEQPETGQDAAGGSVPGQAAGGGLTSRADGTGVPAPGGLSGRTAGVGTPEDRAPTVRVRPGTGGQDRRGGGDRPAGTLRLDRPGAGAETEDAAARLRRLLHELLAEDPARRPDAWTAQRTMRDIATAGRADRVTGKTTVELRLGRRPALQARPWALAAVAACLAVVVAGTSAGVTAAFGPDRTAAVAASTAGPSSGGGRGGTPSPAATGRTPPPANLPATPVVPPGADSGTGEVTTQPDICRLLTDEQLAQLVPDRDKPFAFEQRSCDWKSDLSDIPGRLVYGLKVDVERSGDPAEARRTFGYARDSAYRMVHATTDGSIVYREPQKLEGLGNEAFTADLTHVASTNSEPSFRASVHFRFSNAVVTVEYGRDVEEDQRMRELAVQAARWVGEALAREY